MSSAFSTRYGQGWRECQRRNRELRAAEGIIFAVVGGAIAWAIFAAILIVLWGVML